MLELPKRSSFVSRDDFGAAIAMVIAKLREMYDAEQICIARPEWSSQKNAFNLTLPWEFSEDQFAVDCAISSGIRQLIEREKSSIGRIARVEEGGNWQLWLEAA